MEIEVKPMMETKVSTLGFAILGLLSEKPMSGYDLKLRMAGSVGYFWQAKHSQIYPELAKLEKAGLVSHMVVPQEGRPDKKMFKITDSGLDAVRDWVITSGKLGPTRDEATLKAYLSWLGEPSMMAENFRELARSHEEQLTRYQETEDWMRENWGDDIMQDPRKFAGYAALRRGIGFEREYIEWCQWLVRNFEERASSANGTAEESVDAVLDG